MNRIQEVVHKFRSGNTEKRESGDGGGGGRRGMEAPTTGGHMTAKMADNPLRTVSSVPLTEEGLGQTRWYVAPPVLGSGHYASAMPSSEQSELSALPLLTTSGLQQTMLAALGRSDPVPGGPYDAAFSQQPPSPEKKAVKARPKGTLEYKVAGSDTLEKIAARFDVTPSELKKLNRMLSRTIFENQVLYIPDPEFVPSDPLTPEPESPVQSPVHQPPKLDLPIVKMADKPPTHVPGHVMKVPSPPSSAPPVPSAPVVTLPRALSEDEARKLDEECYERFIKVSTHHICEGFIKVAGTLLVTPNAIMFDPDVLKEGERIDMMEAGGVVVYMDTIISATLYHDLSSGNSRSPQKEGGKLEDKPLSEPDSSSHPPAPSFQTPSSSDLLDGGLSPSVTGDSTLTNQTTTGLSSGVNSVLRASEASVSSGGESSVTTVMVSQDGKSGTLVGGDTSQQGLVEDRGGEITQPSQGSGPNMDPCKPVDSVHHQGDPFSSFTEMSNQPQQAEDPKRDTQLSDEVDIQALLAGGRRDSLSALAAGDTDKVSNIFYPTSPEEVAKAGEERSDTLVKECADKLVSEILESVSWSSGLNTAAAAPEPETAHGEVNHGAEGKRAEDVADLIDVTSTDRAGTDRKPSPGEQELTGTTSTQPSDNTTEKTTSHAGLLQGAESDRQTLGTDNATDKSGSMELDTPPQTTSAKRKPAPLTDLPTDAVDGSSVSESTKSRPESGTFSPLRSSVQHLSNLLDYTTGFFRPAHSEDRAPGKTFDVPLVREKGAVSATRSSHEGREKGDGGGETEQVGGSMFYVKSGGQMEERAGLSSSHGGDTVTSTSSGEVSACLPTIYLHLMVDTVESDRRFRTWSPSEASPQAKTQPHYWFSFPRHKADHLYAFFTQWQPDAFGEDEGKHQKQGFVDTSSGPQGDEDSGVSALFLNYFGIVNHSFKKDWEIVSREEAIRRGLLSMDCSNMPELTQESCILSEQHILQLSNSLPSRTIGYKWSLVYSTNLHGFSLKRLYREVARIDSPILLVLSDTQNTVFGAFLSDPPKLSDHFFGTGMCQLWTFKDKFRYFKWTGENSFFIKGDENSMSVGAGQGVYGLWLDSDLYHGRSHQCTTFNNIVLSATEDFCISALEAWAFVSD